LTFAISSPDEFFLHLSYIVLTIVQSALGL